MASFGAASLQATPPRTATNAGSYTLAGVTGGGGTPVEPKRFLKVGGVAVPIQ